MLGAFYLAVLFGIASRDVAVQADSRGPIVPQNLVYLGQVNGKTFFYDKTPEVTWYEARETCYNASLIMAEVDTGEKERFLTDKLHAGFTSGEQSYWIGGRDAMNVDQFVWDNSTRKLGMGIGTGNSRIPLTCLRFLVVKPVLGGLYSYPCDRTYTVNGVLCQIL